MRGLQIRAALRTSAIRTPASVGGAEYARPRIEGHARSARLGSRLPVTQECHVERPPGCAYVAELSRAQVATRHERSPGRAALAAEGSDRASRPRRRSGPVTLRCVRSTARPERLAVACSRSRLRTPLRPRPSSRRARSDRCCRGACGSAPGRAGSRRADPRPGRRRSRAPRLRSAHWRAGRHCRERRGRCRCESREDSSSPAHRSRRSRPSRSARRAGATGPWRQRRSPARTGAAMTFAAGASGQSQRSS